MLPVIAIVGRTNVGKSTLFNRITRSRDAIVADEPGVTRDRQYGRVQFEDRQAWVIDTGGMQEAADPEMAALSDQQVEQAIEEADQLFFVVDAKQGLTPHDEQLANRLRKVKRPVMLVINKGDRVEEEIAAAEFHQLGFDYQVISAQSGRGVDALLQGFFADHPAVETATDESNRIPIAVLGRPNVGKSTLVNRMIGEERVIACDRPGTTRDRIHVPFEHRGQAYTLIDTAGIRRRSKIPDGVERFSVLRALQAVDEASVVIMVLDASERITEQDLRLMRLVLDIGRGLVIAINKWDHMEEYDKEQIKSQLDRRLQFVDFCPQFFISALHGTGVGKLFATVNKIHRLAQTEVSTSDLTQDLEQLTQQHQPPLSKGRRIRLRYAHMGGHNPFTIVIHGKQLDSLPGSYLTYLKKAFRKKYQLEGIPIHLRMKRDDNPYSNS